MPVDSHNLARITTVSASEAIGPEATAFTPWLAEHICELGDAIGSELTLGDNAESLEDLLRENTEVAVGQFSLDIRAFSADGRIAAIENQYGKSDHKHLGQVMTYSAGVGADIVIWVAEDFTDPHLETLRWLNKRTDESFGVYAIRIRFVRIEDSRPAPQFEVVVAPSATARAERKVNAAHQHWTRASFLEALVDPDERAKVERILTVVEATDGGYLWFGRRPGGQLNLHPLGIDAGPSALSVNSEGRALIRGHWTFWTSTYRSEHFEPLADFLGQSIEGPASWLALERFDHEHFLELSIRVAERLQAAFG